MTKKLQYLVALVFVVATSTGVSAEAQRKAPSVEPSVAETVKEQQAPRIRLPQQQTAPAAPQLDVPVKVDVSSNRVRLPGTRISSSQRKQLAEGLAQRAVTGVGRPTFLEYDKLQVSVPRKIETSLAGYTRLFKRRGIDLIWHAYDIQSNGRLRHRNSVLGIDVFMPPDQDVEFFLLDIHYTVAELDAYVTDWRGAVLEPELAIYYDLLRSEQYEYVPVEDQPSGTFSVLIDPDSAVESTFLTGGPHSFIIRGADVTIKAIEIRPVR